MRVVAVAFLTPVEETVLESLAEMALSFGPTTSFDEGEALLWVDITGCAHLHGPTELEGERALASALGRSLRDLGYLCRLAVADGPRLAAAVARHAPVRAARSRFHRDKQGGAVDPSDERPFVVPRGRGRDAMGYLPIAALRVDDETRAFLSGLGLVRLHEVQKLPRASLAMRLGAEAQAVMRLLDGDDPTPLRPHVPKEVPEEHAVLEYGVQAREPLVFVAKTLCDRLGPRLRGRALGAGRLDVVFKLDRALVAEGDEPRVELVVRMPAPLQNASDLFAVLKARFDSLTLPAPALEVTLRAFDLCTMQARTRDMFVPEAKADAALPRLVAELVADYGEDSVGLLALADSWRPEARGALVPYGAKTARPVGPLRALSVEGAVEPSRCLPEPRPLGEVCPSGPVLAGQGEARPSFSMRLEAVEWWKAGAEVCDYGTLWIEGRGLAWIEVNRTTGERRVLGWVD